MKTRLIAITTLVLVLALPVALYAQEADPAVVATALANAVNAGDVEAALATFADDAVVNTGGPASYTGQEEIRAWLEGLVLMNFEIDIEILQVDGDTVTTRTTTWSDFRREFGIAPLVGTEVYTVQDGKIKGLTYTMTDETPAKLQAAMAALPETVGAAFPTYALVMALGGLVVLSSFGLELLRRRSHQQG